MSDVKREVWVVEEPDGTPLGAHVFSGDAVEYRPANSVRYVPAESSKESAGQAWVPVADGLPDSDVNLALIHEAHGWPSIAFGLLEISDDSEGQGEPYWETTVGQRGIGDFTHYRVLGEPPSKPEGGK